MIAKASIAKHPIHPMLIPFPIGLFGFSFLCDLIFHWTGNGVWRVFALYSMAVGELGALCAAVPGLLDLLAMHRQPMKKIGIWHMSINLVLVALYLGNLWWRLNWSAALGQTLLSSVTLLLLVVSGWLGGELVYVHGAAVAEHSATE